MEIDTIVISAGGKGTRMRDLLGDVPKILAPIEGVPFLHLVLNRWKEIGIKDIHMLLGYKSAEIWMSCQEWLSSDEENQKKVCISASIEPYPLGVGGALVLATSFLNKPFILTYGDVYPTVDIKALCECMEEPFVGCMAICPKEIAKEPGNIELEDEYIVSYDKSKITLDYVDVGAIALKPEALQWKSYSSLSEGEILNEFIRNKKLKGYLHYLPSKHIGDPQAYTDFVQWFQRTGEKNGKEKI
jgi:lmbO